MSVETCRTGVYKTPENAPTDYVCRRLFIPDDLEWLELVNGALGTLGISDFFTETDGGVSIDETCAELLEMIVNSREGCPEGEIAVQTVYLYYDEDDGDDGISLTQNGDTPVPLTSKDDPDGLVTLYGTAGFIPVAGDYEIDAIVCTRGAGRQRLFLKTGASREILGLNGDIYDHKLPCRGRFTADGSTTYFMAVYTNQSGAYLGRYVPTSLPERHGLITLRKVG